MWVFPCKGEHPHIHKQGLINPLNMLTSTPHPQPPTRPGVFLCFFFFFAFSPLPEVPQCVLHAAHQLLLRRPGLGLPGPRRAWCLGAGAAVLRRSLARSLPKTRVGGGKGGFNGRPKGRKNPGVWRVPCILRPAQMGFGGPGLYNVFLFFFLHKNICVV